MPRVSRARTICWRLGAFFALVSLHDSTTYCVVHALGVSSRQRYKALSLRQNDPVDVERTLQHEHVKAWRRQTDQPTSRLLIVGTDESGTGCIAGPLYVVSCCILAPLWGATNATLYQPIPSVADGKSLSADQCRHVMEQVALRPHDLVWTVAVQTPQQIDAQGVTHCTMQAMADCMTTLVQNVEDQHEQSSSLPISFYGIVDGHRAPSPQLLPSTLSCRPWKQADGVVYTVAVASCIARTLHETYMRNVAHVLYPHFFFHVHGGYPTRDHVQALDTYGPIDTVHRTSCQPVRQRMGVTRLGNQTTI